MESGTSVRNHWSVKLVVHTDSKVDNLSADVQTLAGVLKQKLDSYAELAKSVDGLKFSWKKEETVFFGDVRLTTQPGIKGIRFFICNSSLCMRNS